MAKAKKTTKAAKAKVAKTAPVIPAAPAVPKAPSKMGSRSMGVTAPVHPDSTVKPHHRSHGQGAEKVAPPKETEDQK